MTVFLLLRGWRPEPVESAMLRAVLVPVASHGITGQSAVAVAAAADCRSDFLPALIAGFTVGSGPVHPGATAAAMLLLRDLAAVPDAELARQVEDRLARSERLTCFGHRFHSADPRARTLLELAVESGFEGRHLAVARRVLHLWSALSRRSHLGNAAFWIACHYLVGSMDRRPSLC